MKLLRIYWVALLLTAAIWITTGVFAGLAALATVAILTLLEITFSADNAVVNSKILVTLSKRWQALFMTAGIIFAVFIIRFALPIVLVMLTTHLGFGDVVNLALHYPQAYSAELEKAEPFINAFGGTFLLLIAFSYFIDYQKQTHWLKWLERRLGRLGQFDNFTTFIMLGASVVMYFSVSGEHHRSAVLIAAICAMLLHSGLQLADAVLARRQTKSDTEKKGVAAFTAFLYLLVIDAAFSLDGVIGSFAITNSVLLIMAGLGAGAVWVRAMTAHIIKAKTLNKYIYLEHGAHWAIGLLGALMLLKLYYIEPPEWLVGSLGLIFISAAIWTSRRIQD